MKKFTRDFLLGELGIWRHLRKIGLGLVLALWTTLAFAQNPVTYQLKAADYTDCYRTDNSYVVPVMMQDFLKIKKFVLKLDYSASTDFVYAGFTLPAGSAISTMTSTHDAVNHVITFTWEGASVLTLAETVGKMATLFNLNFTIPTFQHQYQLTTKSLFATDLEWTSVELWNDAGKCDILSANIMDGGIDVTQKWMNVVVDAGTANCYGSSVVATVTSPAHVAGMEYSFNGSDENATNKTDVYAPSTGNTLVINDANCISYIYKFDVDAIEPLTFTAATPVYTNCPGGLGDLEIIASKGTAPYKYYMIPKEQWSEGDLMMDKLEEVAPNWETLLAKYEKANYVQQVEAGTPENPRVYWVAAQDANKCATLTGTNMSSWWKKVEVIDNNTPFTIDVDEVLSQDETTCYYNTDGRIKFTIHGGTAYPDGYSVSMNGVYMGRMTAFDSNVTLPCGEGDCEHGTLEEGTYEFVITDANGCSFTPDEFVITRPAPIVFTVNHTDAGCGQAVGTLWIDEVISGGTTIEGEPWQWWYTTDPEWKTNVSAPLAIDATATKLPAGYYYVKVADGNGCEFEYTNAAGDKAIKILTTEFDIKPVSPILCFGGSTSVEIVLVSGDAGHTFEYSKDGNNWQASNKFTGITAGTYTFYVKDLYPEPDCVVPFTVTIDQPKPLKMWVLDGNIKLPTCPGALDGNVPVKVMGGTPFEGGLYKFSVNDGRPPTVTTSTNNFAFGAGTYTITVEDKNGCEKSVTVEIKDWDNFIDFAEEIPVACAGDEVNLFNANPWNDNIWWDKIGLDWGFLEDFQWFPYVNHEFDDEMVHWSLRWTSGDGWEYAPIQGNMMSRNPKLYISKEYSAAADIVKYGEIVGHDSKFGAGVWNIVAKDEWGCYSNVDQIKIIEPEKLVVNYPMKEDAECFGTSTGKVQLVAKNGRFIIPETWGVMYQYTMINTPNEDMPELYAGDMWHQVTWFNFNDLTKKDTQTIDLQAGYWWFAVRDYCGIFDQSQIRVLGPIKIEGYDPISAKAAVTEHVKCFNGTNGVIAVTDGKGGKPGALTYALKMGSKTYTNTNTAGGYTFGGLTAGTWTLTVSDAYGCPVYTKSLVVEQPKELVLTLEAVHASCTGAKDGILRYKIAGGTPPYEISTNNDGVSWFPIGSVNVFDSRVGAGTYDVMLRDKNGCTTATKTITVSEPAPIAVTLTPTGVNCAQAERCDGSVNVVNNGTVKVAFSGGWGLANDGFVYVVKLFNAAGEQVVGSPNSTKDVAGDVTFTNLVAGTYKATVAEFNASLFATPIITDPLYAEQGTAYVLPTSGKQNPDLYCFTEKSTTVTAPALIAYNVTPTDVVCANTATGKINVTGITGGVKPYTVTVDGPVTQTATLGATATSKLFEGLPFGHYNVFVTDKNNCQVCLMAVTINNHDPLTLQMKLIKNATCNGATDGQIQVVPTGGVAPYTYAVVLASTLQDGYFPLEELDATGKLVWKTTDTFNVGAGIWVGFVKDAVGCIQGGATLPNGTPIMNHRVNVLEPSKVNASVFIPGVVADITVANGMVSCFGETDGFIKVTGLSGGNGSGWSAKVGGFGDPKWYSNVAVGSKLDGLTATTLVKDPKNVTKAEKYWVIVYDSHQCASDTLWVPVYQPALFEIKAVVGEDAFICPGDLAGIVQIQKVAGGFGAIQYKYEAYEGTSTTPKYVSQWGAVNTFTGQAGYTYKVYAKDANGCDAEDVIFIAEPVQMQVNIENITCFSEPLKPASARITITGEEGRTYQVRYQKYPETTWSTWTSPFASTLDLVEKFTYGDGSEKEGHFTFEIKDNRGCVSTVKKTFVPVQAPLRITICCPEVAECSGSVKVSVSGGTATTASPYVVTVDGAPVANFIPAGSVLTYPSGSHVITVVDAHGCTVSETFVIDSKPVVREATAHAYKFEKVQFKDTEAVLDTMLAAGAYTFKYDFNGCERTLNVTVVDDLVRTATITALQSDATLMGKYREITGTVTAVVPGAGYFVQDANAAWSGIYVADATLTVVEGVGVKVEGTLSEVDNVTTLTAAKSVMVSAPLAITPLVMTDPAAAKNEMYESVLVIVKGARFMGAPAADGSWEIKTTDALKLTVNDWLFPYVPVNGHFYNVTGVVNGKTDLYKLEPRKAADVVDLSTTTPVIDVNNLQFKVYPNPFSDVLNIDNSEKLTRVTVTNIAGQRVIDVQYPERVIRTSNLVSGVYVVTLFTEEGIAKSERLVKR